MIVAARPSSGPSRPAEGASLDAGGDVADVDDLVVDLAPVLEAAQLRDPHVEWRLAALEPRRDRAAGAGLLALRPRPAVLPLPAAMPRPTRVRAVLEPSGGRRSWSFMPSPRRRSRRARAADLLDRDEEADLADHAAGGGIVGISTVCPIRFSPRARTVARLRAMWLIVLLIWVTRSLSAIAGLRATAAGWPEIRLTSLTPRRALSSSASAGCEGPRSCAGHVDRVGRAERSWRGCRGCRPPRRPRERRRRR